MKRKAGPAVKQRAAERARAEASYRFGFTTTGNVAHLVDEYGYALCEAPILYRRDNLMGLAVCGKCVQRKHSGQGARRL